MILASANAMTIDKLAEMADRLMDVDNPPLLPSVDSQKAEIYEKILGKRLPWHCEPRIGHTPDFMLSGIEEVGTVHVGVPARMANHL